MLLQITYMQKTAVETTVIEDKLYSLFKITCACAGSCSSSGTVPLRHIREVDNSRCTTGATLAVGGRPATARARAPSCRMVTYPPPNPCPCSNT